MLVIGLLALIVFGPRRLPEIARSMGKALREFKRGVNEIQRELEEAERGTRVREPPVGRSATRPERPGGPTIARGSEGEREKARPGSAGAGESPDAGEPPEAGKSPEPGKAFETREPSEATEAGEPGRGQADLFDSSRD